MGPLRVLPGRLSVSRTFGDIEAKLAKFGGNPNVVISTPEIKQFKITKEQDFIVLACDGIFDKLSNSDVMKCVWQSVRDNDTYSLEANSIHKMSALGVEYVMKNSLMRKTLDNVTVVLISFTNFKHIVFGEGNKSKQEEEKKVIKENIPPPSNDQKKQSLQIQTPQSKLAPAPLKTTTHLSLKETTNCGDKHFEFGKV